MPVEVIRGRLVLAEPVAPGRVTVEYGWTTAVEPDARAADGPYVAPGFVDVHVHGWGGHDATSGGDALSGIARALLRHGVTSCLPTAPSLPAAELPAFADRVRAWMSVAPAAETRGRAARIPPRMEAINAAVRSQAGPGWPGRDPVGVLGPGLRKLWRPGRRARTIVSQPIGGSRSSLRFPSEDRPQRAARGPGNAPTTRVACALPGSRRCARRTASPCTPAASA